MRHHRLLPSAAGRGARVSEGGRSSRARVWRGLLPLALAAAVSCQSLGSSAALEREFLAELDRQHYAEALQAAQVLVERAERAQEPLKLIDALLKVGHVEIRLGHSEEGKRAIERA